MPTPDRATLGQAIAARRGWAVETLSAWVRFASVLGSEGPAQEFIAEVFATLGLEVRREPLDMERLRALPGYGPPAWPCDGKANVIGIHDPGSNAKRSLVFNGHVDVVSPEPARLWSAPPFEPLVRTVDGETWLHGRGAGDMKGGVVCYLWALAALRDLGLEPASRVVCQSVVEEECTGNGALSACANGHLGDACIDLEPTDEGLVRAQIGVLWFQVRVLGRTEHAKGTQSGVNAIEKTYALIRALRELEESLNCRERIPLAYQHVPHPINLNVGIVRGGDWASTVAGECESHFRIALFPGEKLETRMAQVREAIEAAAARDSWLCANPPEIEFTGFRAEGCIFDTESDLAHALQSAHSAWRGEPACCQDSKATTDTRFFNLYYHTPATCYGPKAANIHGADERVCLDSMQRVAEVLSSFVADWCGVRVRG
ncbi:MAG: ArgE/DapE family deacylase [Planctomycetota bacterium]|nr:ArgE/DapE family deacylase [Planctomycetota bacterium]